MLKLNDTFITKDSRSARVVFIESNSDRPVLVIHDNDDVYWYTLDGKLDKNSINKEDLS